MNQASESLKTYLGNKTQENKMNMIQANLGLIHFSIYRLTGIRRDSFHYEDIFQECFLRIERKAHEYDPARGKLSTFFMWQVKAVTSRYQSLETRYGTSLSGKRNISFDNMLDLNY